MAFRYIMMQYLFIDVNTEIVKLINIKNNSTLPYTMLRKVILGLKKPN